MIIELKSEKTTPYQNDAIKTLISNMDEKIGLIYYAIVEFRFLS